jgi:DNA topoisomerase-1
MSEQPRITIPCPDCGHDLTIRENSHDGSRFLGCSTYPKCKHSQGLPASFAMREAGAKELPGFEL